jgi:hypothetical protein
MEYYNRKSIVKTIDSASELWELSEVKDYLKVDFDDDDAVINNLIKTARLTAEKYTGRAFINQTWKLTLDSFGGNIPNDLPLGYYEGTRERYNRYNDYIELPIKPLSSITSLVTYARDNSASTYSSSNYTVDTASGRLYLNEGQVFPSNLRARNAVEITFVAGYGANDSSVPADIKQGVLDLITVMYEARGVCEMPCSCKTLLDGYKILDANWLC